MKFRDLNSIEFVTIKSDLIIQITNNADDYNDILNNIKHILDYDEVLLLIFKIIESLHTNITIETIESLLRDLNIIYNIDSDMTVYNKLIDCYISDDITKHDVKNIYTDSFIRETYTEFNVLFASFYLNILINKCNDVNEINRINNILKNSISEFKLKYNRK